MRDMDVKLVTELKKILPDAPTREVEEQEENPVEVRTTRRTKK